MDARADGLHGWKGSFEELTLLMENRLGGRVRDLRVQMGEDHRIILQGRVNTYFAKRLIHQTVLDMLGDSVELANEIVVT